MLEKVMLRLVRFNISRVGPNIGTVFADARIKVVIWRNFEIEISVLKRDCIIRRSLILVTLVVSI